MSDREQIIEAMARAMAARSTGGVCQPSDDDLEWQGWVEDATAALDAALPLIRAVLAEKVRDGIHTVEMARKAVRAGMAVGEVGAWDAALEEAALLIEEVEL